jgi:tRNA (Thr-GGU) A37 N-methylase
MHPSRRSRAPEARLRSRRPGYCVFALEAIDGTPILDLKAVMEEARED